MNSINEKQKNTLFAVLTVLPSVILIGIFIYGFIGNTIYLSFTDWGEGAGLTENVSKNFVGLKNYRELFSGFIHGRFRQDLVNTVYYSFFLLGGTLLFGLFFAILLDRSLKYESVFRTIFLYPMALSFIVTGTIWRWLLAPKGGFNLIPTIFGLPKSDFLWTSSRASILNFNWQILPRYIFAIAALVLLIPMVKSFYQRKTSLKKQISLSVSFGVSLLFALFLYKIFPPLLPYEEMHGFNLATIGICIAAIWQYSGYTMALYLAGLRGLSESIRESARLDGCNELQYYIKIAIPNLKPITLSAVIILAHISLKLFDLIFAMAGADNANTGHPSINMYLTTFRANNFALGASIAVILFIIAALFIIPYMIHTHKGREA
ncbi:MAG: sugar ABC transporter permease [Spirochaetia bacterium]|nr:sugar ABC transporter permease [Spirochaetia bacterium]MCF7952999.1 sugar ABC transporter permease [Spirochaetales bacterium]